jgi:TonB family protein
MTSKLILDNLVAYSLQIGMLVGLAAFVPTLLRLHLPGAKLAYWHILLAACLLVPLAAPKTQDVALGNVEIRTTVATVRPAAPSRGFTMPAPSSIAILVLAGGMLARLGWIAVGFHRLRRYRRHSRPLVPAPSWGVEADVRISGDISSPVTFGWRKPVVLLPARYPDLDPAMQEAILCHEVLHVRRRDWLFTLAEELVRAVFWFHPAIWWLLGEIALAREQAVDREVIELTRTREEYVDALLVIAGANPQLDLAPAPLFLRKRHLKQRVISILKEVRMSKTRLISALAAGVGILAVACWFTTVTFPLSAAPQVDGQGVTIDLRGAAVMHRTAVAYPAAAQKANVQGTVVVEVKLDSSGTVSDAHVVSGPDELRAASLGSVLNWHFTRDSANSTRQVAIAFALQESQPAATATGGTGDGATVGRRLTMPAVPSKLTTAQTSMPSRPISQIDVTGLSSTSRDELLSRLPVHEGDTLTPEAFQKLVTAMRDYDEHLSMSVNSAPNGGANIRIATRQAQYQAQSTQSSSAESAGAQKIRVGGNVQQTKLIEKVAPVYPPDAKAARIQGVVHLEATIGKDGRILELKTIGGHPILVPSAMEAVKQWVYEPTLLNGNPVEVVTQIDVNYTLSQ